MAKQKSGKARQKARKANPTVKTTKPLSPRDRLIRWASVGVGALVVALGIYWGVSSVRADLHEQDLARIGGGVPAIVQVHDNNCAPCLALQNETRAALAELDPGEVTYLVASLNTPEGQIFASQHRASYATLLFFDRDGGLINRLRGPANRNVLRTAFERHIAEN